MLFRLLLAVGVLVSVASFGAAQVEDGWRSPDDKPASIPVKNDNVKPAKPAPAAATADNDAPTTTPVTLTAIAEDSGVRTITQAELLANAGDVEGDSLTATGLNISAGTGTLVNNGDEISFDLDRGQCTLHVDDAELDRRRQDWEPRTYRGQRGYLADFAATVAQADDGCVSRALHG